jgi:hypothetical protein
MRTTDVHVKSLLTGATPDAGDAAGILGRMDIGNTNGLGTNYLARYHVGSGEWQLRRHVDDAATGLGSFPQTLTPGQTYRLSLEMNGSTISVYVNGIQRISVTDSGIGAAGRGGVRFGQGNSTAQPSDSSGLHIDDFRVTNLSTIATDSKGTNNGLYVGGVRRNQPGALPSSDNRAALFDGASGWVWVPDNPSLRVSENFSVEAWIKPDTLTGVQYVLSRGYYYMYLMGSDVVFGFYGGGAYKYVIAPGVTTTGSWQHFVGTYDGGRVRLYRSGVEVASAAQSGSVQPGVSALSIGALSAAGSFFSGTIDDVALYDAALSPADIRSHYTAAVGEIWTTSENHAYKFQITLDNDTAAMGKSGTATFHWEARNL